MARKKEDDIDEEDESQHYVKDTKLNEEARANFEKFLSKKDKKEQKIGYGDLDKTVKNIEPVKKPVPESQKIIGINKKKEKKLRKKQERNFLTQSGALNAKTMHLQQDETETYNFYTQEFRERVLKLKGKIEIEDEVAIIGIGHAMIRLHRKMKLESLYGRFFDRIATQDPLSQLNSCLKQLGLKTDIKGQETNKEAIAKLLTNGASSNTAKNDDGISFEDWKKQKSGEAIAPIVLRSKSEFEEDEEFVLNLEIDDEMNTA